MRLPIAPTQLKNRLVQDGLLTSDQFDSLETEGQNKNQSIFDILISRKVVSTEYLSNLLATMLGVEKANFSVRPINKDIVALLPEDVARQRQAIVFNREDSGVIDAAMADPSDLEAIEFLEQRLNARVRPFLATTEDLNRGFAIYGFQLGQDFKKLIEENIKVSLLSGETKSIEEAASQLPIVAIVNNLLSYAIASRASDIHIEALEEMTMVRYRVDGILYEVMRMPKAIHSALSARIKLLSGLKIDEHFKPQDGRFRYQIVNQIVDVRVAVMPTYYGEKVEMRLLESSQKPLSFEELGFLPDNARRVAENMRKSYGMILVCGPTGSGKTTTLYGLMNLLNRPEVNIVTVEDPIEYNMRYVNQTQVNVQAGITFADALRAFLRQDPNIIMVGEIRDQETAGIAVQAALTGHLLLSSLHTNDAPSTVPRIFDLGVPPFLATSVLNVIIAQRLVRKICQTCITSYEPGPELAKVMGDQIALLGLAMGDAKPPKILYKGEGCASCGGTGYRGRFGIFEVLEISDRIKKVMVEPKFNLDALKDAAREEGMATMFEDGIAKAQLGQTTIEEVLRVIRE